MLLWCCALSRDAVRQRGTERGDIALGRSPSGSAFFAGLRFCTTPNSVYCQMVNQIGCFWALRAEHALVV